ncbi:peptidoglycan-binding protein [Devosia honganensis]|uniref:Peptidoglycan-binding protein n=1 Tax=Devosia honganensis TaxID=1610527 RepID=A0ABV7X6A7_9HYPH
MTATTFTQLPLMAGSALFGAAGRAGLWAFSRYMRAPLASTGLMAMVTLTALAGSNALYFQTAEHPSPFFMPAQDVVAPLPTPAVARPEDNRVPEPEAAPAAVAAPVATMETTGSVPAARAVPDAPVGNAQMFAVQRKLAELQLFTGKVDGYYGPQTAEAIRAFEQRNGMTPTGALDPRVIDAILGADPAGRVTAPQPQAAMPAPAAQPAPAPVRQAVVTPQPGPQDQVVARLPELSPAERAFDTVAQSAADTIDSIIAAVDVSRSTPQSVANPPIPAAPLPSHEARSQPMPAPVQQASLQPQASPVVTPPVASTVRVPPANDTELVTQIQRGLASLGFFRAPVDGKPGPETARAIREFENFHRYRMTGQVQPDLIDLLLQAGATI